MSAKIVILLTIAINIFAATECLKFSSLDTVYNKAVDAYTKERWSECIVQFEATLHLYKVYKSINTNCRLKCKSENQKNLFIDNIDDLKIFEFFLTMKDCVSPCQQQGFEDAKMLNNVSDSILSALQYKEPYAYLHLCYYQMNVLPKAASAAYTYVLAHSDDERMKKNMDYYIEQPEVDIKEVIDLESEDYKALFQLGIASYANKQWSETIANIEETITDYLTSENFCRAECEIQPEQEWSPEFMTIISNYILPVLECRQKCQDRLKPTYASGVEFLADLLDYLQISYYHMNRLEDAAKAVASYLTLLPSGEVMLENKNIYKTLVDEKSFIERSDIVHYFRRDKYEKQLLNLFLRQDTDNSLANSI